MNKMKTFIINLEKDTERKQDIISQCTAFDLDYAVIPAVDGREINDDELKKILHPKKSKGMTRGEIGCSLSHYNIYKKIITENIEFALVLEDDAKLEKDLKQTISSLKNHLPESPTIILLGPINKYSTLDSKNISDNYKLVNVLEAALSHGYLINKSAAVKLLDFLYPIWLEADRWVLMREYNIVGIKGIVPPVITLSELSSTSTIWPTEKELQKRKEIEKERSLTLKTIRRERSLYIKIKLFIWRNFTRKLIGVTSNDQ